ncbi:MAG: NAD-glutamate dehydrogenase domain-containing protein [Gammaproteobacteria bacterium]
MLQRTPTWIEDLRVVLQRALGETTGFRLWQKYHVLFPDDYQAVIPSRLAVRDVLRLEQILEVKKLGVDLFKPDTQYPHYRLHFYTYRERYLDEFIPVLENLHLRVMDQVQFSFSVDGITLAVKSFTIKAATSESVPFNRIKKRLLETIQAVFEGRAENDPLNQLVLMAGLSWHECDVLRTYRNYFLQLNHWTSKASVHHALVNNPRVAQGLFDYFEARFRPNPVWQESFVREEQVLFPLRLQLLENIAAVSNINDDRILRVIFNLIDATVRSNFHKRRLMEDYFIAIKIHSLGVIDMQAPRPHYEIYVHGVDMEGIHLRGGKVSRGGIRWSDRIDDFRTEILDLMQTQISKNALIIPTGAKGGFVVKANIMERDNKEAGKTAYIRFIRGLLDLTDNYRDDVVVSPDGIVVHDDPDPYLVVAADKGTAKFSDIANEVAEAYRFWLGDAFASGGSNGYDHKLLGITARGAWECVKRHFRELGKDIQAQPFTVIGIGSMDGDVFGNGMLLSTCIRLRAAFSGQHIFLDPEPLPNDGPFKERQRLFETPGSSWNDYDRRLISTGGGVYNRTDKDIPVSAELRSWLGVRYKSVDGETLIQLLLKAPVELLWLGGIGTYIKASSEKSEDVGDRANDNVRVDACDVKALVVGEGANLGFTQKARIEYALRGGRIDTDAVNNSAGVDTSDHEVNLKILLSRLHNKGLVEDYQRLFTDMTPAVCELVLADNIAQSLCLSLEQRRCAEDPAKFIQVAERLESAGKLDRAVESFPTTKEMQARPGQALTRPELAVLMSASKMYLTEQLESKPQLLERECHDRYLQAYFPAEFRARFSEHLVGHPLSNQIKATMMSNRIINQAGCGFLVQDESDAEGMMPYANSYLIFDHVIEAESLRSAIRQLDNRVAADKQYQLELQLEQTLTALAGWSVDQDQNDCPNADTIAHYQHALNEYQDFLKRQVGDELLVQVDSHQQAGIPSELAEKLAIVVNLKDFLFMLDLAERTKYDYMTLQRLLDDIDENLGTREIEQRLALIPHRDYWVKNVCTILHRDIEEFATELVRKIFNSQAVDCADYFGQYVEKAKLTRYKAVYLENQKTVPVNLLAYVSLVRALQNLLE